MIKIFEYEKKLGKIAKPLGEIDFPLPSKWGVDWKAGEHVIKFE